MRDDEELAPLVMLYNSRDSYIESQGFTYFKKRIRSFGSLSALAKWKDPLGDAFLRRPFDREPIAFSKGRAPAAMQLLHNLTEAGCGNLGIANPAMIGHFPEVPLMLESTHVSLDGSGAYERFFLSSIMWTHALIRDNETKALSVFNELGIVRLRLSNWKHTVYFILYTLYFYYSLYL